MKRSILLLAVLALLRPALHAQNSLLNMGYKKALFIGAHPDDNESCAGGTMILLRQQGCQVVSVYLTSGERGIQGATLDEAATIRRAEIAEACEVMGVPFLLMTQIDGACEVNADRYKEMLALIEQEQPDVVFTHWPIDSHRDHRVCSILVFDAWRMSGKHFDLYYYEAETGMQSKNFIPEVYVDITSVADRKHEAVLCHKSQNPDEILNDWHIPMELFRGKESECTYAEAFMLLHKTRTPQPAH